MGTRELRQGVSSNVQQVVYGHAELGEYVPSTLASGPSYEFVPDLSAEPELTMFPDLALDYPDNVGATPAEDWHLARRSLLLMPFDAPATVPDTTAWLEMSVGAQFQLNDPGFPPPGA